MSVPLLTRVTALTGAAHGISAILQMLMSVPDYLLSRPDVSRDVKTTLDFLTSLQQPNGNYPCAMDELGGRRPEPEELIHWCHGAPGQFPRDSHPHDGRLRLALC